MRLTKSGNMRDWVVWNLGEEKAPTMTDLGEGEWRIFLSRRSFESLRLISDAY
eukprot:SAG11_NODE_27_length_23309_cov_10.579362_3_plen_53_part_00